MTCVINPKKKDDEERSRQRGKERGTGTDLVPVDKVAAVELVAGNLLFDI